MLSVDVAGIVFHSIACNQEQAEGNSMHSPVPYSCHEHLLAGQIVLVCAHTIAASVILKPKQKLSAQQRMLMLSHVTLQCVSVCFVLC